jgi:hypothetical protein
MGAPAKVELAKVSELGGEQGDKMLSLKNCPKK